MFRLLAPIGAMLSIKKSMSVSVRRTILSKWNFSGCFYVGSTFKRRHWLFRKFRIDFHSIHFYRCCHFDFKNRQRERDREKESIESLHCESFCVLLFKEKFIFWYFALSHSLPLYLDFVCPRFVRTSFLSAWQELIRLSEKFVSSNKRSSKKNR